jgi:hypothetical protein
MTMTDAIEPQVERADSKDTAKFWQVQLGLADKDQQDWEKDARSVVERYRAERKSAARRESRWFNILYSNTETLKSALYGRAAKPDVRRRFADRDPHAREAAAVLERALIYCAEAYDVDRCVEPALHDYLLPGRGVVRIEYAPVIREIPDRLTGVPTEVVADQVVREKYVYWDDYRQNPGRTFDDVWWVSFRHVMSREDLRDNKFPKPEVIPLNWSPNSNDKQPAPDDLKKAEVWEIWDKTRRKRIWIVKGYDKPLRIDDDPYGLEGFFPLPEPLLSVNDTSTLVPRPEYFEYRDQAEDLDEIVGRIARLTRALKRRGVYDQAVKELKRLATAGDNQFIPVENWQALATKGGLAAAFQTEDISQIAVVLKELYAQRDMLVQAIYELTGIADIMRGSSDPNETLGAQQLKAQFGSTRIKRRQRAVQKWIRDLYKLKAEIVAEHFEPQVLQEMTGLAISPEIMKILRSDKLRGYRIDIETDSTVFEDEASQKQQTAEMMTAIGTFMREALPVVQAVPEMTPLAFEMLEMGVRQFKRGRQLEDVIEQTKQAVLAKLAAAQQQPAPPDPKLQIEQLRVANEQQRMQLELQQGQAELQIKQAEFQLKERDAQMKMELERQRATQDMQLADMAARHRVEIATREATIKQEAMQAEAAQRTEHKERSFASAMATRTHDGEADHRQNGSPRRVTFIKENGSVVGAEIQ